MLAKIWFATRVMVKLAAHNYDLLQLLVNTMELLLSFLGGQFVFYGFQYGMSGMQPFYGQTQPGGIYNYDTTSLSKPC